MSTIQDHRDARSIEFADILIDGDFDAFVSTVFEKIPHEILRERFRERNGPHGWVAFQGKTARKWRKYAKSKKFSPRRALFHFAIITEALDYVPET